MSPQRFEAVRQQLDALKRDYRERTRTLIGALATRLYELRDTALLDEIEAQLHKLAGSGGSFGYAELSREARRLELDVRQRRSVMGEQDLLELANQLNTMARLLDTSGERSSVPVLAPASSGPGPVLVWTGHSGQTNDRLPLTLEQFGHAVRVLPDRVSLEAALSGPDFEALLIDLESEGAAESAQHGLLEYLGDLRADGRLGHGLMFALTSMDTLTLRLQAARAGVSGFFVRPFDPVKIVDRLERLREERQAQQGRVLLIDDDKLLARHHAAVLEAGGFEARICTDPMQALNVMAQFHPDMVLIDVYMPGCSGPELARVIRMHDEWLATPLVFLSAETDLDLQLTAASEGADDFLTKPIADSHLLAAVRARVDRARQVAQLIHADSLTGLLKHGRIKEELAAEVARAKRQNRPLSVVMMDIDHFKRVNDRYGHPVGDHVLRALGNLMRQRARKSDRIGRYGGEEFMLILPDCEPDNAERLAEDIRERFSALRFSHGPEEFSVTLSAGIAFYPQFETPDALLEHADQALYAAKQAGRDRTLRAA